MLRECSRYQPQSIHDEEDGGAFNPLEERNEAESGGSGGRASTVRLSVRLGKGARARILRLVWYRSEVSYLNKKTIEKDRRRTPSVAMPWVVMVDDKEATTNYTVCVLSLDAASLICVASYLDASELLAFGLTLRLTG